MSRASERYPTAKETLEKALMVRNAQEAEVQASIEPTLSYIFGRVETARDVGLMKVALPLSLLGPKHLLRPVKNQLKVLGYVVEETSGWLVVVWSAAFLARGVVDGETPTRRG